VVDEQVDPGPGDDRGQLLEELDALEEDVRGAVPERGLQLQQHPAVVEQLEAVLGHRRPQDVPTQALQPFPVTGPDRDGSVEVEAIQVSLERGPRYHPEGVRGRALGGRGTSPWKRSVSRI
jgi:hypothetical protein